MGFRVLDLLKDSFWLNPKNTRALDGESDSRLAEPQSQGFKRDHVGTKNRTERSRHDTSSAVREANQASNDDDLRRSPANSASTRESRVADNRLAGKPSSAPVQRQRWASTSQASPRMSTGSYGPDGQVHAPGLCIPVMFQELYKIDKRSKLGPLSNHDLKKRGQLRSNLRILDKAALLDYDRNMRP